MASALNRNFGQRIPPGFAWFWGLILVVCFLGCGRFESIELPNRPNLDSFGFIQDTLRTSGCSESGCHAVIVGNFRVSPEPASGIEFTDEYQLTKRFVDLNEPANSSLLTVALAGNQNSLQHPVCFMDEDACSYRILLAWITALGPKDPQPEDINCTPIARSCQGI